MSRGRLPVAAIRASRALHEAARCPTCKLPTTVLNENLARGKRGVHLVAVSAATHCACPGGPAEPKPGKRDSDFLYGDVVV